MNHHSKKSNHICKVFDSDIKDVKVTLGGGGQKVLVWDQTGLVLRENYIKDSILVKICPTIPKRQ